MYKISRKFVQWESSFFMPKDKRTDGWTGHLSVEWEIILKNIKGIEWDSVDWINLVQNKKK